MNLLINLDYFQSRWGGMRNYIHTKVTPYVFVETSEVIF